MLAAIVDDLELCILSTGETTHVQSPTDSISVLYLPICSHDDLLDFNWATTEDLYGSDYYPTVLDTLEAVPSPCNPR